MNKLFISFLQNWFNLNFKYRSLKTLAPFVNKSSVSENNFCVVNSESLQLEALALSIMQNNATLRLLHTTKTSFLLTFISSSLSFGLFLIRGRHSRDLHFYNMAFVLRSDALPTTNPIFGWKTGPLVFHVKVEASR